MYKRILGICDWEENYAYRMMEVLKTQKDIPFEVHVFTRVDSLLQFGRKEEMACLLITESAYCEEIGELHVSQIFILNESGMKTEESHFYHISKYQSIDHIVNEILTCYEEKETATLGRKVRTSNQKVKIIGVYTPIKRCLQTTFTMTLGQILARHHKTLYLNYECYSGFTHILNREFKSDITDLMYYFECIREKFVYRLGTITEQINGMDLIPPAAVYPDLMKIPGSLWKELLREMRTECDYEYILLDLSDYVNGLIEILQECDQIYTIARGDTLATAKMEQYERALGEGNGGQVSAKTRKLHLPVFKNIPAKFNELTYGELAAYIRENLLEDLK